LDKAAKQQTFRTLSEAELRRDVLIPLLGKMGFRAASEYHGSREHGKDIVCFDIDRLQKRRYLAVVAKITDLSGSVSSSSGLMEVLHQTEQCFNENYYDLFGMQAITMDEVWIVTSGRIVPGAADAVFGKLKKSNLAKLARVIPGEQLVELVDEYFPTYWDLSTESAEHIRGQRDRLQTFLRDLLRKLGGSDPQVNEVLSALKTSSWKPEITVGYARDWRLGRASAYSIELARMDSKYPKGIASDQCGEIESAFFAAREAVRHELFKVEEIFENGEKVLSTNDPREFLNDFDEHLSQEYPFHRSFHSDAIQKIGYLEDGLNDVDWFLERATKAGRAEDIIHLVESLQALENDLVEYLSGIDAEEFSLTWKIVKGKIMLQYDSVPLEGEDGFTTWNKLEIPTNKRWGPTSRRITAQDVIVSAQLSLRAHVEKWLPEDPDSV
jgi:hypothetical protein